MKKSRKKRLRYCDCGRVARYNQRVLLYRSDLETEIHFDLYLCPSCYALERELQKQHGRGLPKAIRLG